MENSWKSINGLRETCTEISGCSYSLKYAKKHNLTEEKQSEYFGENPSVWVPEPIEVSFGSNLEIMYRIKETGVWQVQLEEKFETSLGTFTSHNEGEFGGELITPKERLYGNFEAVFECDNTTYAIDSCDHMGVGHINIYAFSEELDAVELYSSEKYCDNALTWVSFKGAFLTDDTAYILSSGKIKYDYLNEDSNWIKKTYLFKLKNGKVVEQIELDYWFDWVENILIKENQLIIGMDKVVALVDLDTKKMKAYTPISVEAEKDILKTKEY